MNSPRFKFKFKEGLTVMVSVGGALSRVFLWMSNSMNDAPYGITHSSVLINLLIINNNLQSIFKGATCSFGCW